MLLSMQTNTDCRPADRRCGISYTVHGSPDRVNQLLISYSDVRGVVQVKL